jgi:hypothetical protein
MIGSGQCADDGYSSRFDHTAVGALLALAAYARGGGGAMLGGRDPL